MISLRVGKEIVFKPIAYVTNGVTDRYKHDWEQVISTIVVDEDLTEALDGIDNYSHITVLYYLDYVEEERRHWKKIHPRGREDLPLVGVLASRTQYRPNPIALTTCELVEHKGNTLKVRGLDAIDGSAILDIKPYSPRQDCIEGARGPEWIWQM